MGIAAEISELQDTWLENDTFSYVLPLACTIAYYGDGILTGEEIDTLLVVADGVVKKDVGNRELVKKEVLLGILDSLREALEQVEGTEQKFSAAIEIAEEFSSRTKELTGEIEDNKERNKTRESMLAIFINIANVDGEFSEEEKILIHTIKKGLGLATVKDIVIGLVSMCILMAIVYFVILWLYSLVFG
jgi:tellurite resistance protein